MFLPSRVKEARDSAELSQERLADRMTEILRERDPERWATKRLRARQILRWENGQNEPRSVFIEVLAEATGHDVGFFFGDEDGALRRQAREVVAPFQRGDDRRAAGGVPRANRGPRRSAA